MGVEVERKFLVSGAGWRDLVARSAPIRQGYLLAEPQKVVRVRQFGQRAFLTIKGKQTGLARPEFEYVIPPTDAPGLLRMCSGVVEKVRYDLSIPAALWTVDVFEGANAGLVVLEIEDEPGQDRVSALTRADLPAWVGEEVSEDFAYTNAALSKKPFSTWERA